MIAEYIKAREVRAGDQVLMPDDTTWCTIENIHRDEFDTGVLFVSFAKSGFARSNLDQYMIVRRKTLLCVYCGNVAEGERAIHLSVASMMDGEGPEVPLCLKCGAHETPTCAEIWAYLRAQGVPERSTHGP